MTLIVVASEQPGLADAVAAQLRRDDTVVYPTHSVGGCLRVATSVEADLILLDPRLPRRLEQLLHAHPVSAHARVLHLRNPRALAEIESPRHPVAA